jgi:hypothetical protein
MDFGDAIKAMKNGSRVARHGWNGKGMWITLGIVTGIEATGQRQFEPSFVRPCIVMHDAQEMLVPGWLASQTDMLADDWLIFE